MGGKSPVPGPGGAGRMGRGIAAAAAAAPAEKRELGFPQVLLLRGMGGIW